MQILTKRNLLLGNAVLAFIFLLVAFLAVRPLLRAGGATDAGPVVGGGTADSSGMQAEVAHHKQMATLYPRVIAIDNIFVRKALKEAVKVEPRKLQPLVVPPLTFVGAFDPDGEGKKWIAYVRDSSVKTPGMEEFQIEVGKRFPKYMVVITEVTADYVRYEIRDDENFRREEHFLPPDAGKGAAQLEKDWSGVLAQERTNSCAVDMNVFEKELKILAGPDGDWVLRLANTIKTEPYRPGAENAPFQGYKVLEIGPASPLDEIGLQRQDVIVGLADKPVPEDREEGLEMLREALQGTEIKLHVTRSGKPLYIQIRLNRFE
jgi:hypothetical protein